MYRFLYYKGYIDTLETNRLIELKKDISHDYEHGILEPHQYEYLTEKLNKKMNKKKVICI